MKFDVKRNKTKTIITMHTFGEQFNKTKVNISTVKSIYTENDSNYLNALHMICNAMHKEVQTIEQIID